MIKKILTLLLLSTLVFTTSSSLLAASQENHGQYVSNVAQDTEPGPEHGPIVSEAARNKDHDTYALSFDGIDDMVQIPNYEYFNFGTNDFAIIFWTKLNNWNDYDTVFSTYGGYYQGIYMTFGHDNEVGFYGYPVNNENPNNCDALEYQWSPQLNQWYHFAISKNNGIVKMYINGNEVASETWTRNIGSSNPNLTLGSFSDGQNAFNGVIDEFQIWNKALTQEEIQANMYQEIQPQDGLVGYWKFNEGTGDIAHDSSGNVNDGALINGPTWTTDTPF